MSKITATEILPYTEREIILLIENARCYMEALINEGRPATQRARQERRVNELTSAYRQRRYLTA